MSKNHWDTNNIPDLTGKMAIITGANNGIGYETARALAEKGATVVMACRNLAKGKDALERIHREVSNAILDFILLDLANLESVRDFADNFKEKYSSLDMLINNAGVMNPPFLKTTDGFELQFGTNHLGHFVLTGLLLDRLMGTPGARVVNVSSNMHKMGTGTINFDNLNAEKGYNPTNTYAQSKLSNLLFTLELNHQLALVNSDVIVTSSHPGWTVTGLQKGLTHMISRVVAQQPDMGALPTLQAAVDHDVARNDYFGPGGWMEMRGYPEKVDKSDAAKDVNLAQRLWQVSEALTGFQYNWKNDNR